MNSILTIRTTLFFGQASFEQVFVADDSLLTAVAAVGANVVLGAIAATNTVLMAALALSIVVVFGHGTLGDAERTISNVFTHGAVLGRGTIANTIAFVVTWLTRFIVHFVDSVIT